MDKVLNAVLGAKQNEADSLSNAERKLHVDIRQDLIRNRTMELYKLYADMYGVPADKFKAQLEKTI